MLDLLIRQRPTSRADRDRPAWLRRLTTAIARYRRRRSGLRALRELDPHLLADIGLEPFELRVAAWTGRSIRSNEPADAEAAADTPAHTTGRHP